MTRQSLSDANLCRVLYGRGSVGLVVSPGRGAAVGLSAADMSTLWLCSQKKPQKMYKEKKSIPNERDREKRRLHIPHGPCSCSCSCSLLLYNMTGTVQPWQTVMCIRQSSGRLGQAMAVENVMPKILEAGDQVAGCLRSGGKACTLVFTCPGQRSGRPATGMSSGPWWLVAAAKGRFNVAKGH